MRRLRELAFDNTYARLGPDFGQRVQPTPLDDPYLVSANPDAAALIGLDPAELQTPEFLAAVVGLTPLPGAEPVAMKYAGHQFGTYVPQLGDGRAILLGEAVGPDGCKWDLHLKGAGPTAFSRFGDGRAVLRSSIREYLCSEAMHGLGIPTTRALCVVGSQTRVRRECLEPGATIIRMAPSHIRFGSFEVFAHRRQSQQVGVLAEYVVNHHFPHLAGKTDRFPAFLREVSERTARLMAHWQAVGFAHGVMNTDNMSILGLTIDYGPFGFVEEFDPGWVCNHSDGEGRYAFDRQPHVGLWNVARLAEALLALISHDEAVAALEAYSPAFNAHFRALMAAKLGLPEGDETESLWMAFLDLLRDAKADYTNAFRALSAVDAAGEGMPAELGSVLPQPDAAGSWLARYRARLREQPGTDADRHARMDRVNPRYVLRNWLAQVAIDKAHRGDFSEVNRLLDLLRDPFTERAGWEEYTRPAPDWARHLEVSCSS